MSVLVEFLEFFNEYKRSCCELSKCSYFNKRKSSKNGDLRLFCVDVNYDGLNKELQDLAEENHYGKKWVNFISYSCQINKNIVDIKLNRAWVNKSILVEIFQCQSSYGSSESLKNKTYKVSYDKNGSALTQMRVRQTAGVISGLVALCGGSTCNLATDIIRLSPTAKSKTILVCPVSSEMPILEEDYYQFWRNILIAMSNHKDISEQTLGQLTDAAVIFDLLSVKINKPLILDLTPGNLMKKSNKGAIFVLYNYIRVCMILERFDFLVQTGVYQPLPTIHEINYSLLSEEDEWILVYDLLSEWPSVIIDAVNLTQPKLHRITTFLSSLALTFSVYYRHTRVLTEGLDHLTPLIYARVHLLMAIKQVFLNAFSLLGIHPPRTM